MNGIGAARSDAYDMMFDRASESHRVGMSLIVPLGNEAAKNRLLEGNIAKGSDYSAKRIGGYRLRWKCSGR